MPAQPRTSVIMPVYNTAATVVNSIESVLNQTDPDLELLVVIDGSPDDAAEVVARYLVEHPDPRVRVLGGEENHGVSHARNQGLAQARGQWIAFLDSDDRYRPDFLEVMHQEATDHDSDMVVCGHALVGADGTFQTRTGLPHGVFTGTQAAVLLMEDRLTPFIWNKLFRASLFDQVQFASGVHRGEDALIVLRTTRAANRVSTTDKVLYDYSVDAGGLTWGRVAPVEESDRLMELMAEAAGPLLDSKPGARAYAVAWTITYVNNAQQALVSGDSSSRHVVDVCRRRITWRHVTAAVATQPVYGVAAGLLKTLPGLYRSLYRRHVARTYGLA